MFVLTNDYSEHLSDQVLEDVVRKLTPSTRKYHCQPATVSATEFWNKDLLAASAETGGLPIEVMSVVPAPLKNDQKQVPLEANGMHKRKFQKVQPVDDSGRKPRETEGRLDWKERAKARQKPTEDVQKAPFSKYFKPRYASFPRGTRLTEERIKEMKIRYQLVPWIKRSA
ncbi:hypothetical protein P3342_007297 [Pyrenophora teres f. teres]|nr:hypothetical protein P3342_007297 [Pyrenophora teres f. teres]